MAQAERSSNLPTGMSPGQVFAALVNSSDDAIITKTLDGLIASWNQGAVRMYGYTPNEVLGQPMTMLSPPDRGGEIVDILAMVSAGERISHYETVRRRKDGTTFPVSVSVSPIRDEYGTTVGAASIARDITEQRQLRTAAVQARRSDDLARANQNLTGFAYSVSHDLRTPLRALSGFSSALLDEYADVLGEQGRGYAQRIAAAADHMSTIIDALLRLSRLARAEIRFQTVDLSVEAGEIAENLQRQEPGRIVRFDIRDSILARGDRGLIRAVLQELIGNAWKFTSHRDDAVIEVGTTPTGDAPICCYVRDNGAGFNPGYSSKLFEPFQRLHDPDEFAGTGLGLATVSQLVKLHRGRTWAEGEIGEGATFYFTLNPDETDRPAGPAT
jgi:PAS domain S-box-containing protein